MVAPAGQVRVQLPRQNFVTLRWVAPDKASLSIRTHRAALFACADAACWIVQRAGSSGAGHFKCGADPFSQTSRALCRWAKIAAMVRPPNPAPGKSARQARGSRWASNHWFMASLTEYVSINTAARAAEESLLFSEERVFDRRTIRPPPVRTLVEMPRVHGPGENSPPLAVAGMPPLTIPCAVGHN